MTEGCSRTLPAKDLPRSTISWEDSVTSLLLDPC